MAVNFLNTTDPRKIAENQRGLITQSGDQLMQQNTDLANQAAGQYQNYTNFLDPIEQQLAQGGGGYTPTEVGMMTQTGTPTDAETLARNFLTSPELVYQVLRPGPDESESDRIPRSAEAGGR
jgi:deoxyribodipyrimidine photolyase